MPFGASSSPCAISLYTLIPAITSFRQVELYRLCAIRQCPHLIGYRSSQLWGTERYSRWLPPSGSTYARFSCTGCLAGGTICLTFYVYASRVLRRSLKPWQGRLRIHHASRFTHHLVLRLPHPAVHAVCLKQLAVTTSLHYTPGAQHQDFVGDLQVH